MVLCGIPVTVALIFTYSQPRNQNVSDREDIVTVNVLVPCPGLEVHWN